MASDKSTSHIGIAMSGETMVGVHLKVTRDDFETVAAVAVETPTGALDGTAIVNPGGASVAIRRMRRELNAPAKTASVALLSPAYSMRNLRLPDVPPREQRTLARGELEESGGLPIGAGAFDMLWIPSQTAEGTRQADVYAYTTSDAVVEATRSTLQQSGLSMRIMEPASIALMRTYLAAGGTRDPVAILCPSLRHTDLLVHDGVRVRHLRRIPSGISDLPASDLRDFAAVNPEQAFELAGSPNGGSAGHVEVVDGESIPADFGDFDLPGYPGGSQPQASGQTAEAPAMSYVGLGTETASGNGKLSGTPSSFLETEVVRSLAFYARQTEDSAAPRSLVILGAPHMTAPAARALGNVLIMPVRVVNPAQSLGGRSPKVLSEIDAPPDLLAAAIGAALGAAGQVYGLPAVDISQQEKAVLASRRAPVVLLAGMAGSTAWMLTAALAGILLTFSNNGREAELNKLTASLEKLKIERAPAIKYGEQLDSARVARGKVQVPIGSILGRAAASTQPGLYLKRLQVEPNGKISIEGVASAQERVESFVRSLGSSPVIRACSVDSLKKQGMEWSFRIAGVTGRPVEAKPHVNP